MKILFIQVHSGIGGATTSMYQLVRELKKRGHTTEVLITGGYGPMVEWLESEGINVRLAQGLLSYGHGNGARTPFWSFPPFRPLTDLRKLPSSIRAYQRIIEESKVDMVYLNTSVLWPAAIAAKRVGVKVITHVREVWYHGLFGLRKKFLIRLTERKSDSIIVLSEFSKTQFHQKDEVHVAYNAVDFERYDKVSGKEVAEMKSKIGLDPSKQTVIMLGGALPHKGGTVFLKTAARILKNRSDVQFVVLGHVEPYYPVDDYSLKGRIRKLLLRDPGMDFQKLVEGCSLNESLILPGLVTNVPEWIRASDVLVFPATTDHFGRPIIEAGYMEVPVIASNTNTSAELVKDGINGILFSLNSSKDLSDKLTLLLDDENLRKRMGVAGKSLALEHYSLTNQLDTVGHVLNVTMNGVN